MNENANAEVQLLWKSILALCYIYPYALLYTFLYDPVYIDDLTKRMQSGEMKINVTSS